MRRRDALEWLVLGISALAITAVVVLLAVDALDDGGPADPRVVLHEDEGRQGSLGWIIPVTVTNAGDESVEGVVLEATTQVDGAEETSQIDLPFLPAQTEIDAEIAFSSRPDGAITVRLLGHRLP